MTLMKIVFGLLAISFLTACGQSMKPIKTVEHVDLPRFMGDWYVIANIPTFIEVDAYNAIENYEMNDDGSIATRFTFNKGSADGEKKSYKPTGYVVDETGNAVWGMQFIWPFKAEYRVIYLSEDYDITIIGRSKRDYVWLMARSPNINSDVYRELLAYMSEQGYDINSIQKVPQIWPQDLSHVNSVGAK